MPTVPPAEKAYQLAHKDDRRAQSFPAWCIVGLLICGALVALRLWVRKKLQKIGWKADDYTIIAAYVRLELLLDLGGNG